jgi:cyclohexanecarboxylate-CoA ligase
VRDQITDMESSVTAPTLWALVEARAAATPDAIMLIDEHDRTMTFAEYRDACERAAAGFFAQGLRSGATVSWQIPTWIETLVLMAALSRLGVRQVPLLPIYRERELTFCLRQTRATTLFVPGTWRGYDYVALAERARERIGYFDIVVLDHALPAGDPAQLPPPPAADDAHERRWVYYTSGTTSDPKGAQHTDHTSIASGIAFNVAQGPRPDDRYGVAFPFTHVGGLGNLCAVLNAGFSLVLTEFFDPPVSVELFRRHGCTMVGGGSIFFKIFLDEQRKQPGIPILPKLRFMTGGGAPMPPELHYEVKREMGGMGCANGWGMTESCITAINDPRDTDEHIAQTSGKPIPSVEVRVVLADGRDAPAEVDGELRIRGERVFKGYLDPALNETAFDADGWFCTGDIGHLTTDGYVVVTGRLKDIIIRKGENISAKEVEDLLYAHPDIADAAVIGLPDRDSGERVCAVVTLHAGRHLTLADLTRYCREAGIMRQKIPEQLEIVDSLPRNATGKVLKHELRARFA